MNYHNITTNDMLNGEGLRSTLWVSGCDHYCVNCHNKETWDSNSGILFDRCAEKELFDSLRPDYISGLTISGGDPLNKNNILEVQRILMMFKLRFPNKTVWLYTGYRWEDVKLAPLFQHVDVLVDGKFEQDKYDINYPYAGSTNQRVIDVQKSLKENKVILYKLKGVL